jgi:molybdenum cofactor cytidylyltransferase
MNETGIVILAAGKSSRLGRRKQELVYQGKTLLQRVADEAVKAHLDPIIMVTGAYAEDDSQNLNCPEIQFVNNPYWEQGIASSIVTGMNKIIESGELRNVMIAVCDQPFISALLFQQLIGERIRTGKQIVACAYADTIGTPVLFSQNYFRCLLQLKGDEGAKKLLRSNRGDVAIVQFPKGEIDIDTLQDYEMLVNTDGKSQAPKIYPGKSLN